MALNTHKLSAHEPKVWSQPPRSVQHRILPHYDIKTRNQIESLARVLGSYDIAEDDKTLQAEAESDVELALDFLKLIELMQTNLTRRSGTAERWSVSSNAKEQDAIIQQQILTDLASLGMTTAITPKNNNTRTIVILGASKSRMQQRLQHAKDLIDSKQLSDVERIVLLAGERPVTIDHNGYSIDGSRAELEDLAKRRNKVIDPSNATSEHRFLSETDLIEEAYKQTGFDSSLQQITIDTPRGNLPRPTTETTVKQLLQWYVANNSSENALCFVSNQPYVKYQEAVIKQAIADFIAENPEHADRISKLRIEVIGQELDIRSDNKAKKATEASGSLGSWFWAAAPQVIEQEFSKEVQCSEQVQQLFAELYARNKLVYTQYNNRCKPS